MLEGLEERCLLSGGFTEVNLASDVPGLARVLDAHLVNSWGLSFSPTGPFWIADNGSGVSDILDGRGQAVPLVVRIPAAALLGGTPTGVVFNGGSGFDISENGLSRPSRFLFATEDGTISGWTSAVDPTHALLAVDNSSSGAVYKGLALAVDPTGHSFLYAANFSQGTIDVFDQNFQPVVRPGAFQDPTLPAGFAPFNIQNINNLLFVTYAKQDATGYDHVAGAGNGFIDVYDTNGNLVQRFASQGALNSPWGLALAPADFGPYGGALLVGNNGDGRINAYNPVTGAFLGQLADPQGQLITIPNLWALTFGNGHEGGSSETLFFAAGVNNEENGLFGAIQSPQRRGASTAGLGTFDPNAPGEPGDYPLPPREGPALRDSSADRPLPTSDFLPLRESSLALAPTLSILEQHSASIEALVPSQPARSALNEALALRTFLDVSVSPQGLPKIAGVQRPESSLVPVDAGRSVWADLAAQPEGLLTGLYGDRLVLLSSQEPAPETLVAADQKDEVLAEAPSKSRPQASAQLAEGNQHVEAPDGGRWTNWTNLFMAVSIPVIWSYWLRQETRSRQRTGEPGWRD